MANTFKACTCCGNVWENLSDLIRDEQVHIIGYQVAFSNSYEGLFFFAHRTSECGTTIAIPVSCFLNLYNGSEDTAQLADTQQCDSLCQSFYDFSECSKKCSMRWVRDVIQMLEDRGPEDLLARLEEVNLQQRCA